MKFQRGRFPSGLSLIETLLVTALFVLTIVFASSIFVNNQRAQSTAEAYDHLLADSRSAMDYMAQSIRSSTVDYPAYYDANPRDGVPDSYTAGNGPLELPVGTLRLVDPRGVRTSFALSAGVEYLCTVDPAQSDASTKCDGAPGAAWIPLTSTDTNLTVLQFTILPGSNLLSLAPTSAVDCGPLATFNKALGVCSCSVDADCPTDQSCQVAGSGKICRAKPTADSLQPRVTILLKGTTKKGVTLRNPIETTVTSRVYLR